MAERDEKGRFVGGQSGNPKGRKPLAVSERVTDLLDSVVTPDDWARIATKLKELALRGNLAAINALFDRRFGKPTERKELAGPGGEELLIRILDEDDADD